MSNGIYIVLGMAVILVIALIRGAISTHKVAKMQTALSELHEMPIDEWEAKWAEYVQEEYNKVDDPHREEVESDMEFFRKCREELKEGDEQ
jgi:BMFP domain-containing protein YqiC